MPFLFTAKSVKGLELGVYTLFRVCENVLCFDSHALPTINVINYVPRFFTVHVYGHVMSGI